jgi:hypothetical protein
MIGACRVYHHTPLLSGNQPEGWCVLEYASPDQKKMVTGLFRLAGEGTESEFRLRLKGVNQTGTYRILSDNRGEMWECSGAELMDRGLRVSLPAPMSSELLLIEKIA